MVEYIEALIMLVFTFITFWKYCDILKEVSSLRSIIRENNFWYQIAKSYISKDILDKINEELDI